MRLLSSCYCVTRCTLDEQPFGKISRCQCFYSCFYSFGSGQETLETRLIMCQMSNPLMTSMCNVLYQDRPVPKVHFNLMKLTPPIIYFYDLHCQLTWHGKILQCTKNGLLMSTRVLWKETKILLLLSFYVGKNSFYIAFSSAMFKWQKGF